MANQQSIYLGASGALVEIVLLHSAGKTVSGATPVFSYVSPGDTSLQQINNPEFYELPINQASGHYLVRPTLSMVDKIGTSILYASGVGRALGQTGLVQSEVATVYLDIIPEPSQNIIPKPPNYITGTNKFGASVLPTSHRPTVFKQATY